MAKLDTYRQVSLSEVHETVQIPSHPSFIRRLFAFAGPAYMVSVGYMDPGNWATDIAGGSKFGYTLIWVLLMSNVMAVLLQSLSVRMGVVSRRDLAQASREYYGRFSGYILWFLCEIAIAACDLAEVLGAAIGLKLLFGIPLAYGVIITALDTILILFLHQLGIRKMEAFIIMLVSTIGFCFGAEIVFSGPEWKGILSGFIPRLPGNEALYIALGILGATVMPHNLYLHSALVQSRKIERTPQGIKEAIKFNIIDSVVALNLAFFVNSAILVMSAAVFFQAGYTQVADIVDAHALLAPLVGTTLAPILFAVALIASGQSSTITGTLAGQIVMEGFLNIRIRPWLRRLITRLSAIIPALITITYAGEGATGSLLILSQVILSLQLSFAIIPLIHFVSDKVKMGMHVIPVWVKILAWMTASIIAALNIKLVFDQLSGWFKNAGEGATLLYLTVVPLSTALVFFLMYITFKPWLQALWPKLRPAAVPLTTGIHKAPVPEKVEVTAAYRRVALGLDFSQMDRSVLSHGLAVSPTDSTLILLHVVESAGAKTMGAEIQDVETLTDMERLERYAGLLRKKGRSVEIKLGYGSSVRELVELVKESKADLLVLGGHGHRTWKDFVYGATADEVRHRIAIPVLIVRNATL